MTVEPRHIEIEVLRYRPGTDADPVWQSFRVPFLDDTSVLEGLQAIKDDQDGSLSFRWSCRMAICGSCGMMVDGKPRLSCKSFLRDFAPGPLRVSCDFKKPLLMPATVTFGFVRRNGAVHFGVYDKNNTDPHLIGQLTQ